jgi:hypothetical protein
MKKRVLIEKKWYWNHIEQYVTLEFEPHDLWVGLYFRGSQPSLDWDITRLHLYFCVIPLLPIHFLLTY